MTSLRALLEAAQEDAALLATEVEDSAQQLRDGADAQARLQREVQELKEDLDARSRSAEAMVDVDESTDENEIDEGAETEEEGGGEGSGSGGGDGREGASDNSACRHQDDMEDQSADAPVPADRRSTMASGETVTTA